MAALPTLVRLLRTTLVSRAGRVGVAGLAAAALYAAAPLVLPAPPDPWRSVSGDVLVLFASGVALAAASRAARVSREGERLFWSLLAASAAASACGAGLFAIYASWRPGALVAAAAHLCAYAWPLLMAVALMLRPDQPRTRRQAGWAALEAVVALVLGYFLILHLLILPASAGRLPWSPGLVVQEGMPAAVALTAALAARRTPFVRVYQLLAAGLVASAAGSALAAWALREFEPWSPVQALAALPMAAVAVAAQLAPCSRWLRAPWLSFYGASRALLTLSVAVPPAVDLLARAAFDAPARLAAQRTELALCASAILALVVSARLRGSVSERPRPAIDADEARLALGEPNPYLQFTSGVAHELNNPLTAISGWAELALHAGGEPKPLRDLLASARSAAEVVQQLQRATREAGAES